MGNNPSVRQFRTDMLDLSKTVGKNFHQETLAQADELISNMRNAIQHSVSGHLAQSLRKKDVTDPDETKISVLVIAGGYLTTRRTASGHAHDYSVDEEFGNVKEVARPFFYSSARFYKQQGLEQFRETLDQTIEENNQVRDLRSANYTTGGATISAGHRGAVVIKGKI